MLRLSNSLRPRQRKVVAPPHDYEGGFEGVCYFCQALAAV